MNRTALRKILAEEGLIPSRTASAPTALAKLVLTAPGYESLSSRDAMNVAKQLVKTLLTEIRDGLKDEIGTMFRPIADTTEWGAGYYEAVVGSGGGPASGPPGWGDEDYYDVTETTEFEYPRRMKIEMQVRADLGPADLMIPMVGDDWPEEEDLFAVLAKSRLWKSIVNDAFKGMWRKWLQKDVAEDFAEQALEVLEESIDNSEAKIDEKTFKISNVTYQVKSVAADAKGEVVIDLVFGASFSEPEID